MFYIDGLRYGQVGDAVSVTTAGIGYPRVVFLLPEPFPQNTTVYAFKAGYRNKQQMRFQIWRPAGAVNSYHLVTEVYHSYGTLDVKLPALEEVSIESCMNMTKLFCLVFLPLVSVWRCEQNGDKSRLSETDNFKAVLSIRLEMRRGLLKIVLSCRQFCSHHDTDKIVLSCPSPWCKLRVIGNHGFQLTRSR